MPAASLPDIALASGSSVIYVDKADVAMDDQKELMLMGAAAEVLLNTCSSNSSGNYNRGGLGLLFIEDCAQSAPGTLLE